MPCLIPSTGNIDPGVFMITLIAVIGNSFAFGYGVSWLIGRAVWMSTAERRRVRGLCACCGYDLRGGHARCPECGAALPPPAQAARL